MLSTNTSPVEMVVKGDLFLRPFQGTLLGPGECECPVFWDLSLMGNPPSTAAQYVDSERRPRGCLTETGGAAVYTGKG